MHKRLSKVITLNLLLFTISILLFSCGSTKQLRLFQDVPDSTRSINIKLADFQQPVIRQEDIISVTILTIDAAAPAIVNAANSANSGSTQTAGSGASSEGSGFVVDKDGNIEMPELGKIKLINLTLDAARDTVKQRALIYFKEPIVILKRNIKVAILGETNHIGFVTSTNDKFSVLDALAQSGGLTDFGKRDNILLLRKNENNTLTSVRLNLKSSDIFKSPYFYLHNNDIINIDPNKSKGINSDQTFNRTLTLGTLGLSLFTTFFYLIRR